MKIEGKEIKISKDLRNGRNFKARGG